MQSPSHSCKHLSFLLSLCECVLDSAGIHSRSSRQHGHLRTWLPHDPAHQHHTLHPVHTQRYERTFYNLVIVSMSVEERGSLMWLKTTPYRLAMYYSTITVSLGFPDMQWSAFSYSNKSTIDVLQFIHTYRWLKLSCFCVRAEDVMVKCGRGLKQNAPFTLIKAVLTYLGGVSKLFLPK